MSATSPSARPLAGRHAIATFLTLALVSFSLSSTAFAGDRPATITYSKPGAIPQLDLAMLVRPTKRVLITNEALHPSRLHYGCSTATLENAR